MGLCFLCLLLGSFLDAFVVVVAGGGVVFVWLFGYVFFLSNSDVLVFVLAYFIIIP